MVVLCVTAVILALVRSPTPVWEHTRITNTSMRTWKTVYSTGPLFYIGVIS